ncbi:MAG: type VI secretion system protein ImpL [Nitrospiraceae bacterium]|nr:MAG: type VI secretion system protein ImpL [Nitrospiraceae bacterium]
MKDTLLKVLKISLIAITAILVVLLIFGITLSLDWPWWVGFFLLLALVGIGIGVIFLRKLMLRKKEQQFVQQVIAQDEARMKAASGKEKDELKDLQAKWKEAVEALRRSHLRKYGNPLYVLPWYLIMGESGSGKTTSIKSARLSSPFVEVTHTSGISGTRNCDWWFFEQAIIIDTAGRYAVPVDEGKDKEEWQGFLSLLVKYRKKEPLHGLIVTVAANKLLEGTVEALEEDGKNIRRRIDELMRVLGIKFPVYVLVTKCDLIQGMTRFCDHLPEESTGQPMGVMNSDLSKDIDAFIKRAMNTVGERLRNLRILLLNKPEAGGVDPGLLLFPEEFENLSRGIEAFMKGAFQENPYQETPVLRGLFFSSGRQEGSPYSHFLSKLGLIGEKEVLPGTNKGLFLHDFFSKILPGDRGLFAPTRRAVEWQTLTRNLGLVSWVIIGIAICGLLSFSFVKNLRTLRGASREFAKPPVMQRDFMSDLVTMNRFSNAILKVEEQNRGWWIPRFGLNESINVEKGLKEKYCGQYRSGFLSPLDRRMKETTLISLSASTPDEVVGQYIVHFARRINLLKARLDGEDAEAIKARPQPSHVALLTTVGQDVSAEERQTFGRLYFNYIIWRSDIGEISKEIDIFQSWLKQMLALKTGASTWLAASVNSEGSVPAVTLGDFWGGTAASGDEPSVAPAFTSKGKEMVDSLIREIESAIDDPLFFSGRKQEFNRWLRNKSFETWEAFCTDFSKGKVRLKTKEEWQKKASQMSTDEGPYFALVNKIASELKPLTEEGSAPSWLSQVYEIQSARSIGTAGKGAIAKAAEKGKGVIDTVEKKLGRDTGETAGAKLSAISASSRYQDALNAITAVSASRNQAYQMAAKTFSEDPAAGESPFYRASRAADNLKYAVAGSPSDIVRSLISGPFDFLWEYTLMETACDLQSQWEEKALAEVQGASGQQAVDLMLGQDGLAWKFVKETAAPFVRFRQGMGYGPVELFGRTVPFKPSFFSFLKQGAGARADAITRQSYNITIKGLPTDSNQDAKIKPHATHLDLQCVDGTVSLNNYHFPVSKTFIWSPQTCNDTVLKIDIGNIVLTRFYRGPQGFADFLAEFQSGSRSFNANEFPQQSGELHNLGIRYIKVNYSFRGAQEVLNKSMARPGEIVRSITACWGS